MRRIRLVPITAAVTLLLTLPAAVSAHAELVSSDPAPGDRLDEAPSEVTVTFDGELAPESGFIVTDADGHEVGAGGLDLDVAERNVLRGAVTITEPGVYTVAWTAVSDDDHPEEGSFTFGYDANPTATSTAPNTALRRPVDDPLVRIGVVLLLLAATTAGRRLAARVPAA
jgi:methionine-rich copper-binding protein CopC